MTPRQRWRRQARRGLLIGAAAFLSTAPLNASLALAAGTWRITVTGPAVSESAVVPMGKVPTATVLEKSIKLEWAPSMYPTAVEVSGYAVMRQGVGSKDAVKVCTVTSPVRACEDAPPTGEPVIYTVVPTEQLWRGPASPPSSPVTMTAPTVVPAAAVASPSPSPSPNPSPDPTPTANPTASPTETPSPTPTPRPSIH